MCVRERDTHTQRERQIGNRINNKERDNHKAGAAKTMSTQLHVDEWRSVRPVYFVITVYVGALDYLFMRRVTYGHCAHTK